MFENSRPKRSDYPTATPAEFHYGTHLLVGIGEYVVNRDGDIVITTTSNKSKWPNEFLRELNEPYFRAKYLGNRGDYLEFANQSRKATPDEVAKAKQWIVDPQATASGQLILL